MSADKPPQKSSNDGIEHIIEERGAWQRSTTRPTAAARPSGVPPKDPPAPQAKRADGEAKPSDGDDAD